MNEPTRTPRTGRPDPRAQLWRTVKSRYMTGTGGRTVWASGDGYWIAHQSIVGPPPANVVPAHPMAPKSIRTVVDRYTHEATTPFGKLAHQEGPNGLIIIGQASYRDTGTVDKSSPVRVAFEAKKFNALRRCIALAAGNAIGFEMRVDPWRRAVSWWHPRGYPVAVLLGIYATDDLGWPS